jgi:hypothetical protein
MGDAALSPLLARPLLSSTKIVDGSDSRGEKDGREPIVTGNAQVKPGSDQKECQHERHPLPTGNPARFTRNKLRLLVAPVAGLALDEAHEPHGAIWDHFA